jgi:molybdopterin-guanine dinucleotide biosynthesis protein A
MPGTLGVLVAGGAGSRLGLGVAKALVRVGESTLLERALRTLAAACDHIVVAAPAALALPLPPVGPGGATPGRVVDVAGPPSPLAGIVAGLSARPFDRAVVLGVDFPFATPAALEALIARLGDHDAVVPGPGGFPQPLAAAYAPSARTLLRARLEGGERSVVRALGALEVLGLDDDALGRLPGGLENLNTRDDLAEAERRLAAREAAR